MRFTPDSQQGRRLINPAAHYDTCLSMGEQCNEQSTHILARTRLTLDAPLLQWAEECHAEIDEALALRVQSRPGAASSDGEGLFYVHAYIKHIKQIRHNNRTSTV